MLLDPVIVSCCPRTRAHTHTDCLWLSPVWQIKLMFNRFHGDQNKAFLYWQHSVSQTPCVLFHCSIVGTFMTEEQAPTPSRVLPDASMTWLIFFLHGHQPTSCQPLFASHQITFWRRWRPKNVFSRSELMSLTPPPPPSGQLKRETRCCCPFVALPAIATVKKSSSKLNKSSYLILDQIFEK